MAPLSDRLFTKGKTAMSVYWSNQVQALEKASGADLTLLRFPSMTGRAADAKLFYNVSMMWSVPARGKNSEAAAALVNYLVNDPQSASVLMAERGMPANTALRTAITADLSPSDKKAADYLRSVEPDLTHRHRRPRPGSETSRCRRPGFSRTCGSGAVTRRPQPRPTSTSSPRCSAAEAPGGHGRDVLTVAVLSGRRLQPTQLWPKGAVEASRDDRLRRRAPRRTTWCGRLRRQPGSCRGPRSPPSRCASDACRR